MCCCHVSVCVGAGVAGSGRGQDCTENGGRDQPCGFVAWNHQGRLLRGRGQVRPGEPEHLSKLGVTSELMDESVPDVGFILHFPHPHINL